MLGALQYHFQQFLRIRGKKISKEIPLRSPEDRFEAVAYITRIGQLHYFAGSPFVRGLMGRSLQSELPRVQRLLSFRHKYAAHRARDNPRSSEERTDDNGDWALGALGGELSVERFAGAYEKIQKLCGGDFDDQLRRQFEVSYKLFEIYAGKTRIELNIERDHLLLVQEIGSMLESILEVAWRQPRD